MKKDFLQPKIEFINLNNITVLTASGSDNVVDFPDDPSKIVENGDL